MSQFRLTLVLVALVVSALVIGVPAQSTNRPAYLQVRFLNAYPSNQDASQWFVDFYLTCFYQDSGIPVNTVGADVSTYTSSTIIKFEYVNSMDANVHYSTLTYNGASVPSFLTHPNVVNTVGSTWLIYDSRVSGTFAQDVGAVRDYPYDSRNVSVIIESSNVDLANGQFFLNNLSFTSSLQPTGEWQLQTSSSVVFDNYYDYYQDTYSRAVFTANYERRPEATIIQIIIGVMLMYMIHLASFAFGAGSSARVQVATLSYVGIIIFLSVTRMTDGQQLVSRLDRYNLLVGILITITVLFHGIIAFIYRKSVVPQKEQHKDSTWGTKTQATGVVPDNAAVDGIHGEEESQPFIVRFSGIFDLVIVIANVVVFVIATSTVLRTASR